MLDACWRSLRILEYMVCPVFALFPYVAAPYVLRKILLTKIQTYSSLLPKKRKALKRGFFSVSFLLCRSWLYDPSSQWAFFMTSWLYDISYLIFAYIISHSYTISKCFSEKVSYFCHISIYYSMNVSLHIRLPFCKILQCTVKSAFVIVIIFIIVLIIRRADTF